VLVADRDPHSLADHLVRVDLLILDELGDLPVPISGGQMRSRRASHIRALLCFTLLTAREDFRSILLCLYATSAMGHRDG
jgi:hypothetical protein